MRLSYRGGVALAKMMLLPCDMKKTTWRAWYKAVKTLTTLPGVTATQKRHLTKLLKEAKRRRTKTIYSSGMATTSGERPKGRKVTLMPFGTWYYKN